MKEVLNEVLRFQKNFSTFFWKYAKILINIYRYVKPPEARIGLGASAAAITWTEI